MSTIAAISTAPGIGGIGIIRMSGKECFEILDKIFVPFQNSEKKDIQLNMEKSLIMEKLLMKF